jgi:hypothetical protein
VAEIPDIADGDDDLRELRALASRLDPADVTWETPGDDLWDRIAADAAGDLSGIAAPPEADERDPVAPVVALDGARGSGFRQSRALPWVMGAAAAVLVLAIGAWLMRSTDEGTTVLASSTLDQLQDTGTGTAELVDRDGSLQLHLDTADLDPGDGFLEVWVIDPEVSQLVSLGPLRDDGIYDLPAGLDPEAFPIVDISAEPLDGDPTHSGDSLLRGQLQF